MPNGTVKFFNTAKGFGFITPDAGGKEIFFPAASLAASGIAALGPGQRLSYEELPDGKGPKAVNLVLLTDVPRAAIQKGPGLVSIRHLKAPLTFYHDHTSEWSSFVLAAIRDLGHQPVVVDYLDAPPSKDRLKELSRLMRTSGESLVKKFHPLFLDLRLDDRFIGENMFWEAIVEHPVLIDGPLIATATKAGTCHTEADVARFFDATPTISRVAKPKGLTVRALEILAGTAGATHSQTKLPGVAKADGPSIEKAKGVGKTGGLPKGKRSSSKASNETRSKIKAAPKKAVKARPKPVSRPKAKPAPKDKGRTRTNSAKKPTRR